MPVARIPIDGLWRCLCPSIDSIVRTHSVTKLQIPRTRALRPCIDRAKPFQARQYSTSNQSVGTNERASAPEAAFGSGGEAYSEPKPSLRQLRSDPNAASIRRVVQLPQQYKANLQQDHDAPVIDRKIRRLPASTRADLPQGYPRNRLSGRDVRNDVSQPNDVAMSLINSKAQLDELEDVEHPGHRQTYTSSTARTPSTALAEAELRRRNETPTHILHEWLRAFCVQEGALRQVTDLVEYLILVRRDEPAIVHYEALIKANADAECGSAVAVRCLLEEMKGFGILATSGVYHGALQALAIHPDYILQADILQAMNERWLGLSPEGWHSLIVGLLRDRQLEVAMDKLEQMLIDEIRVQPWLYDILLYQMCEASEYVEAYKLLQHRFEVSSSEVQPGMWYYLLDKFSGAFEYEATKFIWQARVETSELIPSDGMCVAVLNLASRHSDPALATAAVQTLSKRRTVLSPFHYEALIGAYLGVNDLETAFRVLTIMMKAGFEPDANTTRPLYIYLSGSRERPSKAWEVINSLHDNEHEVPIAAINVAIESSLTFDDPTEAVDFYKSLHRIVPSGPNTDTVNILLQGASKHMDKKLGMFIASEIQKFEITPDSLTYDRLILLCVKSPNYDDAFRYLDEMEQIGKTSVDLDQKGWWMRPGTAIAMFRRCIEEHDARAWTLLDQMEKRGTFLEMERRGMSATKLKEWAKQLWK